MPAPHYVNYAMVGATPDGIIRLEFGEATANQVGPPNREPITVVAMTRDRAAEVARVLAEVLAKSAPPAKAA